MQKAVASWYNDAGSVAGPRHYTYGVAHKTIAFGTKARMCAKHCVTVRVEDRGPFIVGRTWDLNANVKYATGCSDICTVRTRIVH